MEGAAVIVSVLLTEEAAGSAGVDVARTYPYSVENVTSSLQFVTVYCLSRAVSVVAHTIVIVGS